MFNIGDLVIYSAHGMCRIDDIKEKAYLDGLKRYYIVHPLKDCKLEISVPVDNEKQMLQELLDKEQAEEILESFKTPGVEWIERDGERQQIYSKIVKKGNRKEIANIANTLMKQKIKIENEGRKFRKQDQDLLNSIQDILFEELAYSINTNFETIHEKINAFIGKKEL